MKRISSFTALNVTQTLVTLIDSMFRLIVVFALIDLLGMTQCNQILSVSGAVFIAPFLVFSMPAGHLADRFSKREVIIWSMWGELFFMLVAAFAIYMQNVFGAYLSLFLVAVQASIFSPAKYAILPEIVPQEKISYANGRMTLWTYIAVILGTFFASFIADMTGRNYVIITLFCAGLSAVALFFSYFIEKTPAQDPKRQISFSFLSDTYQSLKIASGYPGLLLVCVAASYFLFTASYTQLNLIPFGVQSLQITDVQAGYIYLAAAVGIGVGALIATALSGTQVKLWIAVWGAFGTAVSYFLLYFFQYQTITVIALILSVGLHEGLYIVPLNAYIQVVSPEKQRGSIIAASTFLGVVAVLMAAGYLSFIGDFLSLSAALGFFVISLLTFAFSFYLSNKIVFNKIE